MISFKSEINKLKDEQIVIERKLLVIEEVEIVLKTLGITGNLQVAPSMEDWVGFDEPDCGYDFSDVPLQFNFDRRWIGFPELNEYDYKSKYILFRYFNFDEDKK